MNLHAPQSYETEAELRMISLTQNNIITPQESKPIITITQDSLTAMYLMTSKDFKLSRRQFLDICLKCEKPDGSDFYDPVRIKNIEKVLKMNGKKGDIFNGKGLISLTLPPNFNYEKKNSAHSTEHTVKIIQGVLIEGALDKSILGSAHGSIIQLLNKEYGVKITSNFIDNIQFIGNNWLLVHGFSIGLEDCMITSDNSVLAIKNKLTECYTKAQGIEETTQNKGIREIRVTASLSQAKDIGMKIAKEAMRSDNNFLVTVISGSKGDYFNISQITGLLGQQNLEGKRVAPSLNHGKRTLPHYPFKELDKETEYESRGFIRHSFIRGLNPQEFFFHAMSGREGVADTAMGTAKSGYIQRKIVKVCEDIQIHYDNTVRDATGKIYQFCYGEDGYDSTKTIRVNSTPNSCDISRLVDRLNTNFENNILECKDEDNIIPEINVKNIRQDMMDSKISMRKIEEEDEQKSDESEDDIDLDEEEEEEVNILDEDENIIEDEDENIIEDEDNVDYEDNDIIEDI